MNTTYEFEIKTNNQNQTVETTFTLEYNHEGECIDGEAFNPTTGYTNYTTWRNGWTEQDPELEKLWDAIEEYSQSPDIVTYIAQCNKNDINKPQTTEYNCEYTEPKGTRTFTVTILDITEEEEE